MARPRNNQDVVLEIPSFHGGANQSVDPDKLDPTQAWLLQDMILDETGTASGRQGSAYRADLGASGDRVLSACKFQRAGQTTQIIVHLSDGTLRWSTDLVTWATIASGLSMTAPFSYAVFTDNVFMANGVNDFRKWDGSTQTTYPSVPKFKYVEVWKDGLWGASTTADPHIVYASAAGDGTTWPALDFVHIAKGQGLGISGLTSDQNALIVFKHLQTHALYDPVEFTNRVVDELNGTISHFSIVKHNGIIYFASHRGICRYLGDAPSEIISRAVHPLFEDANVFVAASEAKWYGYTFEGRVGWCWPRGSNEFRQLEHYPGLPDQPWCFQHIPARILISVKDVAVHEKIYGFGEGSNITMEAYTSSTNNDADGSSIVPYIRTGWFDFDYPAGKKYISRILIRGRGIMGMQVFTDFDHSVAPYFSFVGDGGDTLEEFEVFTDYYGEQFQFHFDIGSTGTPDRQRATADFTHISAISGFSISSLRAFAKLCGDGR